MTSPVRLAALHKTGLLDTTADCRFDALTRLASEILAVPTVLISLVDADRQYFKSLAGETGVVSTGWNTLEASFCQDVVGARMPVVIADAWNEPAFAERGPKARAYAGVPLITEDGHVLGAQ